MFRRIALSVLVVALSVVGLYADLDSRPLPPPAAAAPESGPAVDPAPEAGGAIAVAERMTPERASEILELPSFVEAAEIRDGGSSLAYTPSLASREIRFEEHEATVSIGEIRMTSLFGRFGPARASEGRVYYERTDAALVYAPNPTGVKEDLVLYSPPPSSDFAWSLALPSDMEARLMDDGSIGIFTWGEDALGGVTVCDDKSAALINKARENRRMDRLTGRLPAPTVKDAKGRSAPARFSLSGGVVGIHVTGLEGLAYPVSVDPSFVIPTDESFLLNGNAETMISYKNPPTQINRAPVGGGNLAGMTNQTGIALGARHKHCTVAYNGYLYVIGGINSAGGFVTGTGSVAFALIDPANGGISGSYAATTNLLMPRSSFGAAAINGFLYVFGGDTPAGPADTVHYAPILSNGQLGSWTADPALMPVRLRSFSYAAHRNTLMIMGGVDEFGSISPYSNLMAFLQADGSIYYWNFTGYSLNRRNAAAVIHGEYIYVTGGSQGIFDLPSVVYSRIDPSGNYGYWTSTSDMLASRSGHAAAVIGGHLVVAGGGPTILESASIGSGGEVGPWRNDPAGFPGSRRGLSGAAHQDRFYLTGGQDSGTLTVFDDTRHAAMRGPGSLAVFSSAPSLTTIRHGHALFAWNGRLYAMGGYTDSAATTMTASIQTALINPDGSLGSWGTAGDMRNEFGILTPRALFGCAVYNGYVFVTGGQRSGSPATTDVLVAPIGEGSIGSWFAGPILPGGLARRGHGSVAVNGYLYVLGGETGGGSHYSTIYFSSINSGGGLGGWTQASVGLSTRSRMACEVFRNKIIIAGGQFASVLSSTQVLTLNWGPGGLVGDVVGAAAGPNLTTARTSPFSFISNDQFYVGGGRSTLAGSTGMTGIEYVRIRPDGTPQNPETAGPTYAAATYSTASFESRAVSVNGVTYISGGMVGSPVGSPSAAVNLARINSTGTVQPWVLDNFLPYSVAGAAAAVSKDGIWVSGGNQGGSYNNGSTPDIWFYDVDEQSGFLYGWYYAGSLPGLFGYHSMFSYNNRLYVLGGSPGNNLQRSPTVYVADILGFAFVGGWSTTNNLPVPTALTSVAQYENLVYVVGGDDGSGYNTVQIGVIDKITGAISWSVGPPLLTSRYGAGVAVSNGRVYTLGGYYGGSLNQVESAQITDLATGTLAAWSPATSLPMPLWQCKGHAQDGFLYSVGGGYPGSHRFVYRAIINADGSIGTWNETALLPVGNNGGSAFAAVRGHMYMFGGGYSSGITSAIYRTGLLTPAHKASWSRRIDLGADKEILSIEVDGTGASGGKASIQVLAAEEPYPWQFSYNLFLSWQEATLGNPIPIPSLRARWLHVAVEMDDTTGAYLGVDGGGAAPPSMDLTSITCTYNTRPELFVPSVEQRNQPSNTPIATGGAAIDTSVEFRATVSDDDAGDQVRLYLELRPYWMGLSNIPTHGPTAYQAPGTVGISVATNTLTPGEMYIWQIIAEDSNSAFSQPVIYPLGPYGFSFYVNQAPDPANNIANQYQSGGLIVIPVGADSDTTSVVISEYITDPDGSFVPGITVALEVEVKSITSAFDGSGVVSSPYDFSGRYTEVEIPGLTAGTYYHWRARTKDDAGVASAWTSFGANSDGSPPGTPADADFRATGNTAPSLPTAMKQRDLPSLTGDEIDSGDEWETETGSVSFEADISDLDPGDSVKLQIEIRPLASPFSSPTVAGFFADGINFFQTSLVAQPAPTQSITVDVYSILGDGSYKWQARVVDNRSTPAGSAWRKYLSGSGGLLDFRVDQDNDRPVASNVDQYLADGDTALVSGGQASSVVFTADLDDPNHKNTDLTPGGFVTLQVEVKPMGFPFDSPSVAAFVADGVSFFESAPISGDGAANIPVPVPAFATIGSYYWQYRAVDSDGLQSLGDWTPFPGGDPDFVIIANQVPEDPGTIGQFLTNGTTVIDEGFATDDDDPKLKATLIDAGPPIQPVRLQVEIRLVGDPFVSPVVIGTGAGEFPPGGDGVTYFETLQGLSGTEFTVALSNLVDGCYHWQSRTVDVDDSASDWTQFGTNDPDATDFRIEKTPDAPATPSGLTQLSPAENHPVMVGGVVIGRGVILRAEATDPENGLVALDFEIQPVGTAFSDAPTHPGTFGPPGLFIRQEISDLAIGSYHWQVRSRDAGGLTSAWQAYGANPESEADFTIDATTAVNPNIPISIQQKLPGDTAPVPTGGLVNFTSVLFKAVVVHPRGDSVKLQVEVEPVGVDFDGVPTKESVLVNSGTAASALVFGLINGDFHWQCRTVDARGGASAWVLYGGNTELDPDFSIDTGAGQNPLPPVIVGQYKDNGVTPITIGGMTGQGMVVFRAFCVDPNGDAVRLVVEAKPLGRTLNGAFGEISAVSALHPNGSEIVVALRGLCDGPYAWQATVVDSNSSSSVAAEFGGNTATDADFVVAPVEDVAPEVPTGLDQVSLDGLTAVPVGAVTSKQGVILRGFQEDVGDPINPLDPADQVRLEIEIRPAGVAFSDVPTAVGDLNPSGFTSELATVGFAHGTSYHWQMRVGDSSGLSSGWSQFGGNSDPDEPDFHAALNGVSIEGGGKNCGSIGFDLMIPLALIAGWRRLRRRKA